MSDPRQRTPAELDSLKREWGKDPCWDIERTEGFEAHTAELTIYRLAQQAIWQKANQEKLEAFAEDLGCPGNLKLAAYVQRLETRLQDMEMSLERQVSFIPTMPDNSR